MSSLKLAVVGWRATACLTAVPLVCPLASSSAPTRLTLPARACLPCLRGLSTLSRPLAVCPLACLASRRSASIEDLDAGLGSAPGKFAGSLIAGCTGNWHLITRNKANPPSRRDFDCFISSFQAVSSRLLKRFPYRISGQPGSGCITSRGQQKQHPEAIFPGNKDADARNMKSSLAPCRWRRVHQPGRRFCRICRQLVSRRIAASPAESARSTFARAQRLIQFAGEQTSFSA